MDYSNMAPGGLIPQLGAGAAVIPDDLDFGLQPDANALASNYPAQGMYVGDVPSYMQEVPSETPMEEEQVEEQQELGIGSIKKAKDGSEWLITHWCDVCRVGLCSQKQYDVHLAGKPHEKKLKAMGDNSAAYTEFLRMKDGGMKRPAYTWSCEICNTHLVDADQYQIHLKGKPHEKKMRVRAGNTRVFDYFCDLCGISTGNNRTVYDSHLEGQKHQKRLFNGKMDMSIADPGESAYYCETCKIHMDCASQYIAHLGGQQHLKRSRGEMDPAAEISGASGLIAAPGAGGKNNTYWCDTCKISMSGHQPFEAHMNGAKHKAKVIAGVDLGQPPAQKQPKAGQKRGFSAPGMDYTFGVSWPKQIVGPQQTPKPPRTGPREVVIDKKCEICNVLLKTQSTYDAHMQGQAHVKKAKMLESMGGRVVMPAGSLARKILDNGPQIKDGQLHCPLCDLNFASMTIAQDHFPARKHRQAMKVMAVKHENETSGAAGWITGVSPLSSLADSAEAPTSSAGPYKSFVSGGTMSTLENIGIDLDKESIDAKIKEARVASGIATDADESGVDAHVKAFEVAKGAAASGDSGGESKEGTPAAEGDADAMDMLVREISPHDNSAIVCDVCSIGVSTTQMLENHVVGSKHLKKVLSIAINDGKDVKGVRGKGVPFPYGRGRGRGRGMGMGRGRGRGGGFRGGPVGRPIVPVSSVMSRDNDGSSHDYMSVKHKPPIGYSSTRGNNVTPGWASWSDTNYQPGSGGWTPWTG